MAEVNGDQDQSMEEILQSIKRIIADEDDGTAAPAEPLPLADVLELTDIIEDEPPGESPLDGLQLVAEPIAPAPKAEPKPMDPGVGILAEETVKAGAKSLETLKQKAQEPPQPRPVSPSPAFRSGSTVEDLVLEALRPMLKEWLDENLPNVVEDLVEREIRRISR